MGIVIFVYDDWVFTSRQPAANGLVAGVAADVK
jgi:hypothetical protein